ncbi:MAG: LysE family transporter [Spirochaetota bacterium]
MHFLAFLAQAVFISLSGVMAPGPITAATIGKGSTSPNAGAGIAVGHAVVEIPLMVAIFYGFGYLLKLSFVKIAIGFLGGGFLLFMGIGMLRSIRQTEVGTENYTHSPLTAGVLLSAGNPYFLIWWATLGASLVMKSVEFGLLGFAAFAVVHWSCDLAWCLFLSNLSFRGGRFFGKVFQKVVFGVCGSFLLFFSGKYLYDAAQILFI